MRRYAGLAAVVTLFGVSFAPDEGSARGICFYAQCRGADSASGHAFLQLIPMGNNPQNGNANLVYGHYPKDKKDFIDGPGEIKSDAQRGWDWRICYNDLTKKQYNAAATQIITDIGDTPDYSLTGFNCVDWAMSIADKAGITLPNKINFLGVDDPQTLKNSIADVGDGEEFMGGEADDNNTNTAPNGGAIALVAPIDYTHGGMVDVGHRLPVDLAAETGLPADLNLIGTVMVNTADALQITLQNTDPFDAIISVEWGDGSPREAGSVLFSHIYPAEGIYPASVLVVDRGAVRHYDIEATLSSLATTASVTIMVPTSIPSSEENAGFEGPIVPELEASDVPLLPMAIWLWSLLVVSTGVLMLRLRKLRTH